MNIDKKFWIKSLQTEINNTFKSQYMVTKFISCVQDWFSMCEISTVQPINIMKRKAFCGHDIRCRKWLWENIIHYAKTLKKGGIEGSCFHVTRLICGKLTSTLYWMRKSWEYFTLISGRGWLYVFFPLLFNVIFLLISFLLLW